MPLSFSPADLSAIEQAVNQRRHFHIDGLKASAAALLLRDLAEYCQPCPSFIVLCNDYLRCSELRDAVNSYFELRGTDFPRPELLSLPPLTRLPYRSTLRSGRTERERIAQLARLPGLENFICFTTITAFAERLPSPTTFKSHFQELEWGATVDREKLFQSLDAAGYNRVPAVDEAGDYSVRGGVIDIFSPLYECPLRLDFFGDELESIRPFNPLTQLSRKEEWERFTIAPAREVLAPCERESARQRLRERFITINDSRINLNAALAELEKNPNQPGFENWLPAFSEDWFSLRDFLPADTVPVLLEAPDLVEQLEDLHHELEDACGRALAEPRLVFPASDYLKPAAEVCDPEGACLFLSDKLEVPAAGDHQSTAGIAPASRDNLAFRDAVVRAAAEERDSPLNQVAAMLKEFLERGYLIIIAGRNQSVGERLRQLLLDCRLPVAFGGPGTDEDRSRITIIPTSLAQGVQLPEEKILFLSDGDLFGRRHRNRRPSEGDNRDSFIDDFADIKPGDLITHIEHGIGRYQGLKTLEVEGLINEYLILEYQNRDLLYVPVDAFDQLHKYHGGGTDSSLSRLGGPQWAAAKLKTRQAIDDLILELVDLYAEREVLPGRSCTPPGALFSEFADSFSYEETPDQERAINEVITDLLASRPMDRLVSGDVGFGKTEVAMRAVFLAVLSGRQAAVMVPTTVLAQQHYVTFKERFANYPVTIEVLSRFRSQAEQKVIIEKLRNGSIDIIIGTHRLLQNDIGFKDLGLLVLDEEHKFGVRHKEKLKKYRRQLDVLSLSATPIPRTLQFSLSGMRSLSTITTAPRDRLAIRTYIADYDDVIITEAIRKEINRGGQIFFVHNSISTIRARAARLQALLPELKIAVGHGQMKENELEKVMLDFAAHHSDLLLCTTIIESGLDIPNANTMIIEDAQNFGLAQLYQLRGRIGRAQRKAYAYLLVPDIERLPGDARKRLNALAEANTLGAGFRIAMHDLEIRGAGNLLGRKQSGQISAVGYELYQEMLTEAINETRGNPSPKLPDPELKIGLSTHIPADYLPDLTLRLQFYKRIAGAANDEELALIEDELGDRCGVPPATVLNLLKSRSLKLMLKKSQIRALEHSAKRLVLQFSAERPPDLLKLQEYLADAGAKLMRLTPEGRLTIKVELAEEELRPWCEKLLQKIR